jgi:hypothetical protein
MKVTVVPAQVTTVEDRIAGSLGLNQLLLLSLPVFGGSALYIVLPPTMHSALYKLVVIVSLALVCGLAAIRIKGKIVLLWLVVILRYNLRPRYYVFNKNDLVSRNAGELDQPVETASETADVPVKHRRLSRLSPGDTARLTAILENPAANLTFKATKKGGLNVLITEVED